MPFVETNGAEVHFSVAGDGAPTLLLVAGLGQSSDEWGAAFVEPLARRRRVVRFENRGVPPSTSRSPAFGMAELVADAKAVLDAALVERAVAVGWSLGGRIAQRLALDHPDRVDALVLISTDFGGPERLPMLPRAAPLFAPPPPGTTARAYHRDAFERLTAPGFAAAHADLAERFVAARLQHRVSKELLQLQLAAGAVDLGDAVRRLAQPTLVVHGEDDPLIVVENGRMLAARIPRSRYVELPACGHFPPLERPERVVEAIERFVADLR